MKLAPELVLDARAVLGEGPSWDDGKKVLYWVDIDGMKLHIYDPKDASDRVIEIGTHIGAAVPGNSEAVILALKDGFYSLNTDTGERKLIARPRDHSPENRFNDGKCDANGRFWAGTMSLNHVRGAGKLFCLDIDGSVAKIFDGVSTSNGLAWSSDNKTMYYIDTPTRKVMAYEYDLDSGRPGEGRIAVELGEGHGSPDGMTIDSEGMLWVAEWGGWKVCRWDPRTGELLAVVEVPAAKVTSCCFGGEDLEDLYITTAGAGAENDPRQPNAGGLFRVRPGVKGTRTFRYRG